MIGFLVMTKKIGLVILAVLAIFNLKKCTDSWTGIIYPDKSDLSNFKNIGEFKTLEECRNESIHFLRGISAQYSGDFECGLNCNGSTCEETSR
jgi:hypothetical protein